jgi:hypothetical protein
MKTTLFLALSFLAISAQSGIIGYLPIPYMERDASTILVAKIESVAATPVRSTVVLRVLRTVKGTPRLPGSLEVVSVDSDLYDAASTKSYGPRLWFLAADGTVISRASMIPRIDAASFPAVRDDHIQEVERETSVRGLGLELAATARDGLLDMFSAPQVSRYFESLPATERAELVRLSASRKAGDPLRVASLLRDGAVAGVEELLLQVSAGPPNEAARDALCAYRNPDPKGIAGLSKLLDSDNNAVAVCALLALKEIHTPETVPILVRALDRPDQSQRFLAVAGLYFAANTGQVPMEKPFRVDGRDVQRPQVISEKEETVGVLPPFDVYRASEAQHLAFWKNWASQIR